MSASWGNINITCVSYSYTSEHTVLSTKSTNLERPSGHLMRPSEATSQPVSKIAMVTPVLRGGGNAWEPMTNIKDLELKRHTAAIISRMLLKKSVYTRLILGHQRRRRENGRIFAWHDVLERIKDGEIWEVNVTADIWRRIECIYTNVTHIHRCNQPISFMLNIPPMRPFLRGGASITQYPDTISTILIYLITMSMVYDVLFNFWDMPMHHITTEETVNKTVKFECLIFIR